MKGRGYVIKLVLPALQIKRQIVSGAERERYEMQKVFPAKALLSGGGDPHIKIQHRQENKMKRRGDLIQVRIEQNEFGAMQHAAAYAY